MIINIAYMRSGKIYQKNYENVLVLIGGLHIASHHGIARAARDFGWHLNFSFIEGSWFPDTFRGDGILCALTNDLRMEKFVRESTVPVVDISINRADIKLPRVVADNPGIGKTAAEHLLEFGHQNFAWFSLKHDAVGRARLEGFSNRLKTPVIRLDGSFARNRGRMAEKLKQLPKPCAVFAHRDVDAAWLLSLCLEEGYDVPGEIAVLGVDNNDLICKYLKVPLSSVNHDLEQLGYQAAQLLNQLMKGEKPPESIMLIEPKGVTTRASTDSFAVQDEMVRAALVFMKDDLSRSIGTQEIADAVGVSRRLLETRFRDAVGATVHEKLMELRLVRAEHLLRTTNGTAETIAALTGFCHAQHLSRLFKKRYGEPPLRYRKSVQATSRSDSSRLSTESASAGGFS